MPLQTSHQIYCIVKSSHLLEGTVRNHLFDTFYKLDMGDRTQAAFWVQ